MTRVSSEIVMTFEIVSAESWNVLGTYEDEDRARQAMASTARQGADLHEFIVYISNEAEDTVAELEDHRLADWLGSLAPASL